MEKTISLSCTTCGANLKSNGGLEIICDYCGNQTIFKYALEMKNLEDHKRDIVINGKKLLLQAKKYNDPALMLKASTDVLSIFIDDTLAQFYLAFSKKLSGDVRPLVDFLNSDINRELVNEMILLDILQTLEENLPLNHVDSIIKFISKFEIIDKDYYENKFLNLKEKEILKQNDYDKYPRDFFVSFQSKDKHIAEKLVESLESDGYSVWVSYRNLNPNDNENYWENIESALENSKILIVISSLNSMLSADVKKEMQIAEKNNLVKLEIKIDDSPHTTYFKVYFDGIKWIRIKDYRDFFSNDFKTRIYDLSNSSEDDSTNQIQEIYSLISNEEYTEAKKRCLDLLKNNSTNGEIWTQLLMIEHEVDHLDELLLIDYFPEKNLYNALNFADSSLKKRLDSFYMKVNSKFFIIEDDTLVSMKDVPLNKIVIPDFIRKIARFAFKNNSYVSEIILSDSVQIIEESAFENCISLEKINFHKNIIEIQKAAFKGCKAFKSFELPHNLNLINEECFMGTSIKSVKLSENILKIRKDAFSNTPIQSLYINKNLEGFDANAFLGCPFLKEIIVHEENINFNSINQVLFDFKFEKLIYYPSGLQDVLYKIPASVKVVSDFSFYNNANLVKIDFNNNLETIESKAFYGAQNLFEIKLPSSLKKIKKMAFSHLPRLKKIIFAHDSDAQLEESVFSYNLDLTLVELSHKLNALPDFIFQGCFNLEHMTIPASIIKIGNSAFENCTNLSSIKLESFVDFSRGVFKGCRNLLLKSKFDIPNDILLGCDKCHVVKYEN
jgi:DNA-directed RNA polymerase subunit RPC12/RpoP